MYTVTDLTIYIYDIKRCLLLYMTLTRDVLQMQVDLYWMHCSLNCLYKYFCKLDCFLVTRLPSVFRSFVSLYLCMYFRYIFDVPVEVFYSKCIRISSSRHRTRVKIKEVSCFSTEMSELIFFSKSVVHR